MILTPAGACFLGRRFPCTVGRAGIRPDKREGDGATPAGIHRLAGMLYRPDRIRRPAWWARAIRPGELWCDAPSAPDYNRQVRAPFTLSAERLWRADPLYDLILLTDWNWPDAQPGLGSAIFLHRWRRPGAPTDGCIAFDPGHLRWIAERVTPGTRIVVRDDRISRFH